MAKTWHHLLVRPPSCDQGHNTGVPPVDQQQGRNTDIVPVDQGNPIISTNINMSTCQSHHTSNNGTTKEAVVLKADQEYWVSQVTSYHLEEITLGQR